MTGCPICGDHADGVACVDCGAVSVASNAHARSELRIFVDGSFVPAIHRSRRLAKLKRESTFGCGGAGIVLVTRGDEVIATRTCAFMARGSDDAERQAVLRAALWLPGVAIYTDSASAAAILRALDVDVHYTPDRGQIHALAHQLSVAGRMRMRGES